MKLTWFCVKKKGKLESADYKSVLSGLKINYAIVNSF